MDAAFLKLPPRPPGEDGGVRTSDSLSLADPRLTRTKGRSWTSVPEGGRVGQQRAPEGEVQMDG